MEIWIVVCSSCFGSTAERRMSSVKHRVGRSKHSVMLIVASGTSVQAGTVYRDH